MTTIREDFPKREKKSHNRGKFLTAGKNYHGTRKIPMTAEKFSQQNRRNIAAGEES